VESNQTHNPELQLAYDFVQYTGHNIFLTGRAGTGKTTFLRDLKERSPKRMIVVAPTGVAAINAGGVTIHSFFQLPFGPRVPGYMENEDGRSMRFSSQKRNIIRSLDLLVIDEISMVRADLLDSIDERLRQFRRNNQPFGGVQLLLIGDMQQLPPVVKGDEWELLRKFYDTPYFFSSRALQKSEYVTITLQYVYRQRDEKFINILNKIRDKQVDEKTLALLNERYKPDFDPGDENYIILTTHNAKAKAINDKKLKALKGKKARFTASVTGNFPEYMYPTELELELKVGAQVMFVKNDPDAEKRFFNGKIGNITEIHEDGVVVRCPGDDEDIHVTPLEWQNVKYIIEEQNKEIKETVEGTFTQIPLKLAWAITIHKSQGLTFDKAVIDSEAAFAHGQVYVALSRCRSLEGLVLSTKFSPHSLKQDKSIEVFNIQVDKNQAGTEELHVSKSKYQQQLLEDLFDFSELQHHINSLYYLLHDNRKSLQPEADELLNVMKVQVQKEVAEIAEKFKRQIAQLLAKNRDAEQNEELQERIKKGADYFSGKIQGLVLSEMEKFVVETDNKEIQKKIRKAEKRLLEEAVYKRACLEACRDGFVVKDYLKARAMASLEEMPKKRSSKMEKLPVSKEIANAGLYELLKEWRNVRSEELGVPYFMVLPLKTMRALSNQVPSNMDELKRVHGFGKKKIEQFGEEILELLNEYRHDHELKIEPLPEQVKKKEKKPKINTREVSLKLWLQHKDMAKVALERGLTRATIESHLAYYVGLGELQIEEFVDEEKIRKIKKVMTENETLTLSEIKAKLGDEVSYGELKMVRQHLLWLEKGN
jgi:hypothetical protein